MKKRVLSGMRPSGKLHLGHWLGALNNWVRLQKVHDCFYFVADWHALTTEYEKTENIKEYTYGMICDWLACGVDPEKATIFVQSDIKPHAELYLLLSMITPIGWLERCPTYKEMLQEIQNRNISTHGFLGYPVLQTADIIMYKANFVPVGDDQLAHLELTREIIRRFHHIYKTDIFPEPQAVLTNTPKLIGIDGRKMSKSYDNSIYISDDKDTTASKISQMITDPDRIKKSDPGNPKICSVYNLYISIFGKDTDLVRKCTTAQIGCVECKRNISEEINDTLAPIRKKRVELCKNSDHVWEIVKNGEEKASEIAEKTIKEVREAIKINY
ncbi:tryptophan--tRNA ligase [bacterium]